MGWYIPRSLATWEMELRVRVRVEAEVGVCTYLGARPPLRPVSPGCCPAGRGRCCSGGVVASRAGGTRGARGSRTRYSSATALQAKRDG